LLRQSVRAAAKLLQVTDPSKVFEAITAAWSPLVSTRITGRPADGTMDDCAVIERSVEIDQRTKILRYAAVGLGASSQTALDALIMKLDDSMVEDERTAKFGSKYQLPQHKQ